ELIQVDSGFHAHAVQHVDHVFRGDVAGGASRVGAAAGAGNGTVHHSHAGLQARQDVGQCLAVGIVEVYRQRLHGNYLRHGFEHGAGFGRCADADGVAERDFVTTEVVQTSGDTHHVADRHIALVRTTEHGGDVAAHAHA